MNGTTAPLHLQIDRLVIDAGALGANGLPRDIDAMLGWMRDYRPANATKWLSEKRTRELR